MAVQLYFEVLTSYRVVLTTRFGQVIILMFSRVTCSEGCASSKLSCSDHQLRDHCSLCLQPRHLP